MKTGVAVVYAALAGVTMAIGATIGASVATDNLLHTECFTMEWSESGMAGTAVDCKRGYPVGGEGIFLEHELLMNYTTPLESGDVAKVSWTLKQAELSDWDTPAKIERNGGN